MHWNSYEYRIATHYLPSLINADDSGMDEADTEALSAFCEKACADARAAGFTVGHWDCDSEESEDWGRCDVSGLFAMRQTVRLMIYRPDSQGAAHA